MKLIDSHCHLDFKDFQNDRDQLISNAMHKGVEQFVIPGVKADSWSQLIHTCHDNPVLHFALGMHPYFIDQHDETHLAKLEQLIKTHCPVAIGEIGLDYFDKSLDRKKQQFFFVHQLELAEQLKLPVIVHARKSVDDVLQFIKQADFNQGGIMHAYNGSLQQADKLIGLGFKLGFGGMLTYEKSTKLRSLAEQLPLDSIVLETDAPDMTGQEHHGQRNSPEYLPEIAQALAQVKQMDIKKIAMQTTANVKQLLKI